MKVSTAIYIEADDGNLPRLVDNILYLGTSHGTSAHLAFISGRRGERVAYLDALIAKLGDLRQGISSGRLS